MESLYEQVLLVQKEPVQFCKSVSEMRKNASLLLNVCLNVTLHVMIRD